MFLFTNAIDIAIGIATVLGVGMLIPQTLSMMRTRDLRGVSASWIGGGVAINSGWIVYALSAGLWGLLPVSIGSLVLYVAMAVVVARHGRSDFPRALITAGLVIALFVIAGLVGGGVSAFGLAIALTYAGQFSPAAWSALFSRDISGISAPTWIMGLTEAVIWAFYGASLGDSALLFGGAGASAMSALVLLGLFRGAPTKNEEGPLTRSASRPSRKGFAISRGARRP